MPNFSNVLPSDLLNVVAVLDEAHEDVVLVCVVELFAKGAGHEGRRAVVRLRSAAAVFLEEVNDYALLDLVVHDFVRLDVQLEAFYYGFVLRTLVRDHEGTELLRVSGGQQEGRGLEGQRQLLDGGVRRVVDQVQVDVLQRLSFVHQPVSDRDENVFQLRGKALTRYLRSAFNHIFCRQFF